MDFSWDCEIFQEARIIAVYVADRTKTWRVHFKFYKATSWEAHHTWVTAMMSI